MAARSAPGILNRNVEKGKRRGSERRLRPVLPDCLPSEILCTRWTTLLIREMLCGSTRFNDLRRGVPRMSPALLSKRLKELEKAGIVVTAPGSRGTVNTTCRPLAESFGPSSRP